MKYAMHSVFPHHKASQFQNSLETNLIMLKPDIYVFDDIKLMSILAVYFRLSYSNRTTFEHEKEVLSCIDTYFALSSPQNSHT